MFVEFFLLSLLTRDISSLTANNLWTYGHLREGLSMVKHN